MAWRLFATTRGIVDSWDGIMRDADSRLDIDNANENRSESVGCAARAVAVGAAAKCWDRWLGWLSACGPRRAWSIRALIEKTFDRLRLVMPLAWRNATNKQTNVPGPQRENSHSAIHPACGSRRLLPARLADHRLVAGAARILELPR